MIQINPLKSYIDGGVRAAITTPPSASLVFDLPGKAIWVKGVKLKGTDHTYTFSHDNYITLANTPDSNESEDIKIGVNTSALKSAIDTTYGVVSTTANGLAPKFTSGNKQAATAATTYYFLGWTGTTLKWYQAPFRNIRINSETTDRLGVNSTDPLIISSGNGISVTWDSTNKKIVITNTKPDVNHNTDRTGVKLTTVSGTKKTDSTLILANSATGLNIQGGTNKFLIGDGTNYIEVPITPSFTISNKDATIGTALTTIATIAGVDIKAKIASYSLSNHTHSVKINGSTKTIAASGAVDLGNYLPLSGGTMGGTAWIVWPDSGNWGNNNSGVTFPVIRGGLQWSGQSDYVKLFTEETSNDNLNLVLQFGDDNSNGLSIRNKANTQTSYISSSGVITTGTFKGNLDWSYITNKPSSYTPSAHTHAWNSLTHSSTTENQAILTNGKANGWKLYTLNISGWNNAANNAHSHSNKSVLDGITSTLVSNWNTAYTFINTITGTDTDKVINKWDEIVNFLAGITEDNKLNTLLNSKLSIYKLADNTNVGAIKNNGIYYSTSDASSGTLINSPFNNGFTLINMTSLDNGDDLRRSRLAFNAYGEVKISNDRGQANTSETWYNILTSNNSGINGSTIKLNGTSITVYSSSTADSRFVKKTGDTMSGALNLANNTWNKIGDDSYIGDCNTIGMIGIKAANTTYPGIAFFNNENTRLGNLIVYSNNIKYRTYSLQFLDNGNTSVSAGTWMNPFSTYNTSAVADGQAICVWGQSSYLSNLAADSGDMSLWLKRVSANGATLNMVLDGEYYANGNQRLAHISEIPTALKNPYSLTTFGVVYDGSATKTVTTSTFISQVTEGTSTVTDGTMFITSYASNSGFADTNAVNVPYKRKAIHLWEYIKAKTDSLYATRGHNHDDRYLKLTGGTMTGSIAFSNSSYLLWNNGSYHQRIFLTDDSTADTAVFTFQQSSDSGVNWSNLMTIRDNGKVIANTFVGALQGNASTATKLQTARSIWGNSFNGTANISGTIIFNNVTSGLCEGIQWTCGDNDFARIKAGATGSNAGYLEIATADDGSEPIYVRQYTGVFSSVKRTLTLLDANGYTHFPSYINIGGNENNNSSPDRVWGSNGSDSFLRSYRTSALRVSYANSADTATTSSMLKTADWHGAKYVSSDTHYMCLGYMNCTGSYDSLTLLVTSAFWGNQHGSQDIITIQQDTNTSGTRTIQTTVGRLRLGGSYERTFYYYKDNTNFRLYIYVYVTGGNSYGRWNISYLGGNTTWVNVWQTNVTKDASWISIEYSAQVNYANSAGSATKLQTPRTIWGQSFNGTTNIDNTLRIRQTTGSYCEGIRIQNGDNTWATIILGATADNGTNTNAWSIHRKADNNFAISRNSSDGINGLVMTSVGMGLGTTAPTQRLDVRGNTTITGSITASSAFINTGDSTLKVYSGIITDAKSDGNICLQTSINGTDGQSHAYPTQYSARCNLVLQPRGGQIYVGINPDGGNTAYKLYVNGDIYSSTYIRAASGFVKEGSSNSYVLLGGGGHKIISDFMLKGNELSTNLTTISKSLTVTQAWMDTGIKNTDLPANGTYIVQVSANNTADSIWSNYWSGIMSWYIGGTDDNEADEIILHRAGHAYHHTIYLRTIMTTSSDGRHLRLQIAADTNLSTAVTYTFKFKRVI